MSTIDRMQRHRSRAHLLGIALALTMAAAPCAAQDAPAIVTTVCAGCHGQDGNSAMPMFPNIAGLPEQYVVKQLRDFMNGRRKSDIMAPIVAQLKPEDVEPLAAYFSKQAMHAGQTQDRRLADQGKLIFFDGNEDTGVPACAGCHGMTGTGKDGYPRIANQQPQYLLQQLKNFAGGDRSNDVSRFMRTTAKRLNEEEMNAVVEFLVGLNAK